MCLICRWPKGWPQLPKLDVASRANLAALRTGSMHYERAPRFSRVEVGWGAASAALRCVGLRSATAASESNCSGVCGGKAVQEGAGKSAGEWHFTLGER